MNFFIMFFLFVFSFLGLYYLIKELIYNTTIKKLDVNGDNINCILLVKNKEDSIEMILRKFLYKYKDCKIFDKITIIDLNSSDKTYDILNMIKKEYDYINIEKINSDNTL